MTELEALFARAYGLDDRLPQVANVHEHVGIPREPLPSENAAEFPPHEVAR